jgi:hypothetical protein
MRSLITGIVILTAGICCETHAQEVKTVRPGKIRAFWVMPFSTDFDAKNSWIEINACSDESDSTTCHYNIEKISLEKVLTRGEFSIEIGKMGEVSLTSTREVAEGLHSPEPVTARIAIQYPKPDWYPRAELCKHPKIPLQCRYDIQIDTKKEAVELRVKYFK